jgi:hypothetical protein
MRTATIKIRILLMAVTIIARKKYVASVSGKIMGIWLAMEVVLSLPAIAF